MQPQQFQERFRQLTGYPPFAWQTRLYFDWFAQGVLPAACDVPTGLGKTTTMALWLIARQAGAPLPRRLVYVVDRRAVVDQATRFAEQLQAQAPAALGIKDLAVSTLRGQYADNRKWLQNPAGLSIVVGTVDMIGSRLLFSGYGVSRRMRPYHAGLLGADTLVLLDEAHLCPPFEALLHAVANDATLQPQCPQKQAVVPRFALLPLSATGRGGGERVFRLHSEETDPEGQPVVYQRYQAAKHLTVSTLESNAALVPDMVDRAWALGSDDGPARVLVFCNQRDNAQKVKQGLDKLARKHKAVVRTQLLVGARRVRERQALQQWLEEVGLLGDATASPECPVFLVATSAGEVGVDLDADHLVCDLVAWERMVQRLGRVNRRGGDGRVARVDALAVPLKKDDAHAEQHRACLSLLQQLPALDADGPVHDASPAGIDQLKQQARDAPEIQAELALATTPGPLRPALNRPVVEAWSLTTIAEHPGRPDIAPWIRGWLDEEPQTTVAWRHHMPWRRGLNRPIREEVESHFSAAPVHMEETLESATSRVLQVFVARAVARARVIRREHPDANLWHHPGVMVLDQSGDFQEAWSLAELERLNALKPDRQRREAAAWRGRLLVVSAALGGLDEDGMLDPAAETPPTTLDGIETYGWEDALRARVGYWPVGPASPTPDPSFWKSVSCVSLAPPEAAETDQAPTLQVFVLRGKDGAGAGDRAVSRTSQRLREHLAWTAEAAERIAEALELPEQYRLMLVAAAKGHDLGKQRILWQMAMNAPLGDGPYAKTTGGGDGRRLNGYRHEFGSLRDADAAGLLEGLDDECRDLALHLIAAHHGFARPTITPFDPDLTPADREALAREVAQRFARLQRVWGPWGLAWWESLLRAADQSASARLDEEGGR
ncbi:type I-U CRISPR-associated helicase/endonuclease Cas3 [Aquisalimonas sp.]|uniref:type I-G CRISPR-associated helicase/endonuclease Cas3g n=1 Tax=Aquisalimonas sp. TaxID=1872621 RepID=UPI0025BE77BB|nr:type I-U CRISPR-associated helicase/endonuclease Cas3 [Aquisalimonas sp.]